MKEMTIVIAITGLILGAIIAITVCMIKYDTEKLLEISSLGYDTDDVKVFCNAIGVTYDDFIISKGMREQYRIFTEGKTSDFLIQVKANKTKNDASSSAFTAGIIGGAATGMIMRGGK